MERKAMKVYVGAVSGNSYKVKILLSLLKVPCEVAVLDLSANKLEHKQPSYLGLNPRGEVPVLEDEGVVLWDSAACLVYIARKHGGERWLPTDPPGLARVTQWLALAASEIQFGLQYGRRGVSQGRWTAGTLEQCQATAAVALRSLEARLSRNDWLAAAHATIADIACFPYVETAPEGKVPLDPYPAVRAWISRCTALPGWPPR
jgi:glutathione S-transferase